jgi:O-antigen ligase
MSSLIFRIISIVLVVFSYITPIRLPPNVVALKEAFFSLALLLLFLATTLERKSISLPRPDKWVMAIPFLLLTVIVACDSGLGVLPPRLEYISFAGLAFILGCILEDRGTKLAFLVGIIGGAALLAAVALFGWHGYSIGDGDIQSYISQDGAGGRAQSGLGQSNNFGVFLACCVWVVWFVINRCQGAVAIRLIMWAFLVILLQGIYVSQSRAAVLGLVVSSAFLTVYGYMSRVGRSVANLSPLLLFVILGIFYSLVFSGGAGARSVDLAITSDMQRLRIWSMALELISQRIFSGWGAGSIPSLSMTLSARYGSFDNSILNHFHNTVLDIFVEYGLVFGFVVTVGFVILLSSAWRNSRAIESGSILFAAAFPLFVHAMVEYPLSYGFLLWPLCFWAGYFFSLKNGERLIVSTKIGLIFILSVGLFWCIWYSSYFRVEALYTQLRQGYELSAEEVEERTRVFDDYAFRQYIDRLVWILRPIDPKKPLDDSELMYLERSTKLYPTDLLLWKSAIARAGRDDFVGASWWAERMCKMYGSQVCEQAESAWLAIKTDAWPNLAWSDWRSN